MYCMYSIILTSFFIVSSSTDVVHGCTAGVSGVFVISYNKIIINNYGESSNTVYNVPVTIGGGVCGFTFKI